MKDDYLFIVEKSIFANSHELFFWAAMTLLFPLVGFWFLPTVIVGSASTPGTVFYTLFSSQPDVLAILGSDIVKYVSLGCSVISLLVAVIIVINIKTYKAVFYKDRIVIQGGFIARWEKQMPLTPIVGVHMKQTFFGRLFDYASFTVDKVGNDEWNLIADGKVGELNGPESILFRVSEASAIKECLEEMVTRTKAEIASVVGNHETAGEVRNGKTPKIAV